MEIKKVLNLNDEEFNKLVAAGELLGAIKKAFEAGEIDELSDSLGNLIEGINEVSAKVLEK